MRNYDLAMLASAAFLLAGGSAVGLSNAFFASIGETAQFQASQTNGVYGDGPFAIIATEIETALSDYEHLRDSQIKIDYSPDDLSLLATPTLHNAQFNAAQEGQSECNWQGRAIAFGGRECFNGSCINVDSRLRVIGDRVLYTPAPLLYPNSGWAFQIGSEIDMSTDPMNSAALPHQSDVPSDEPGGRAQALLKAEINRRDLILTRHNKLYSSKGVLVANRWTRIVLRLNSCTSCEVQEMKRWGNRDSDIEGPSTFEKSWCKVME